MNKLRRLVVLKRRALLAFLLCFGLGSALVDCGIRRHPDDRLYCLVTMLKDQGQSCHGIAWVEYENVVCECVEE